MEERKRPKGRGRPRKLTEADLEKVETLLRSGLSSRELAGVMGISRKALTTLLKELPAEYRTKIRDLKEHSGALAKMIIHAELESGDPETARWYLQYQMKRETEKARASLMRAQLKVLQPEKENLPDALPSQYWQKVHDYFTCQDQKIEQSRKSDGDPGDNN